MTAIVIDKRSEKVALPVRLRSVFNVPAEIVHTQYQQEKVNDLSTLWPFHHFREAAILAAKTFVEHMRKQGRELVTAEADITVSGPYYPIDYRRLAGNHRRKVMTQPAIPAYDGRPARPARYAPEVIGEQLGGGSPTYDFLLIATFLDSRQQILED